LHTNRVKAVSVQNFLQPRLVGRRFEGRAIPLEVLKDLAVFEEMLFEVAKWKFFQANRDRKRSPRGFSDGVELKLTALEDGSAKPLIGLFIATTSLFPPEQQTYFEQARDAVIASIKTAEQGGNPTTSLPPQALTYFDRIGRSLRDDEAMEFTSYSDGSLARLTKESRRRLLAAAAVTELTEDVTVRGSIPEADQDKMTFQVQLFDGRKVMDIPLAPPHLPTVLEAFAGYKSGTRVLVEGVGRFDRQQRLIGFEQVQHASILEPLDIRARLEEIQNLKDGWLEGGGTRASSTEVAWFADAFEQRYPGDLPLPYLYPTEEGGLQAEWRVADVDASLEIGLTDHQAIWHSLDLKSGIESTRSLNLDRNDDWRWLADETRRLIVGSQND
jgi:hypothetical protein